MFIRKQTIESSAKVEKLAFSCLLQITENFPKDPFWNFLLYLAKILLTY